MKYEKVEPISAKKGDLSILGDNFIQIILGFVKCPRRNDVKFLKVVQLWKSWESGNKKILRVCDNFDYHIFLNNAVVYSKEGSKSAKEI